MSGLHNMVLFGSPKDELYVYHLPLLAGIINGEQGHVLMHVYQGLWKIGMDENTKTAYSIKFNQEVSAKNPFPFFSISPRENQFKVPEMICNSGFEMKAISAYGHVESNPKFPVPELLVNHLSKIFVKGKTIFARRFDGSSREELTYILFGTSKQQYMAHFITDNENSL